MVFLPVAEAILGRFAVAPVPFSCVWSLTLGEAANTREDAPSSTVAEMVEVTVFTHQISDRETVDSHSGFIAGGQSFIIGKEENTASKQPRPLPAALCCSEVARMLRCPANG